MVHCSLYRNRRKTIKEAAIFQEIENVFIAFGSKKIIGTILTGLLLYHCPLF